MVITCIGAYAVTQTNKEKKYFNKFFTRRLTFSPLLCMLLGRMEEEMTCIMDPV